MVEIPSFKTQGGRNSYSTLENLDHGMICNSTSESISKNRAVPRCRREATVILFDRM